MRVSLQGLSKGYAEGGQQRVVLDGAALDVAPGEHVALIGRSGSGKSTLLNLISGMDRPDAGRVLLGDTELSSLGEGERTRFRRHHVGFVFQFFNLIPTLTVLENLLLPLELVGERHASGRARTLLEAVGLGDRADAFPERLSGGEQQRVALARALVHRPALLLADEPTGTLDAETGAQVLALLQQLVRAEGMTLITVTHSQEVAAAADRVYRLVAGQLQWVDRAEGVRV
ncbi:putative ABC transport system ATP-binding protein [Alkalispirillum mobile]|uniref:Putative ABC transport system ATP-binding protein n=1 Tax=Alkalispirillum mobile TaxID=85925 RepID=A0A498C5M4_9GAMM|nr:ABC transporter ATP-binding protein [Alkalispirillum mobile]RLK50277.1 putative ABC transport system ATP-binding protein [Alkalispirillum mobile]